MGTLVVQNKANGRQKIKDVLSPYGFINDKMIDYLKLKTELDENEIAEQIRVTLETLANPVEYLNAQAEEVDPKDAKYIWVATGLEEKVMGNQFHIAFAKNKEGTEKVYAHDYFCYCIGPRPYLERKLSEFLEDTQREEGSQNALLSEIYGMLLIKGDWDRLQNYRILSEVLKLSEAKIANDKKAGQDEKNCVYSTDGTKIAYNPGLISIYGNDIIIIATLDTYGDVIGRRIAQSKTQLKQEGFEKTDIPPVSFYHSRKDLIFSATAEDFDLDDFGRMKHIIEHRRERFPDKIVNLSEDELFNRIRSSLEFDLKMTARNPYWAAPFYNVKQDEIQYLLPLFTGSFSEEPSLAMVVGKGEHFFEVRTVLPLNVAYANAACLVSPPSTWLRNATE